MRKNLLLVTAKRLVQSAVSYPRNGLIRQRLRSEGLHPPTSRRSFLGQVSATDQALEIGPFDVPQLRGPAVRYFDVLDTAGLRHRAEELGRDPNGVPPIDYVSFSGDLRVVEEAFDVVLSCHAVEHQPDLIRHLRGVAAILRPGGRYLLIIPDRRFTFDYHLPETTLADVLAADAEQRTVHTPAAVEAHFLGTTHNSAIRHWLGQHGHPQISEARLRFAREAAARAGSGQYVDVHAWIFSPARFRQILLSLCASRLVPFTEIAVHETDALASEFFAVLTLPRKA